MAHLEDDEYEIPLRDQRYFGAGIKRKRVKFVPSTSTDAQPPSLPGRPSSSAASRYIDIVLKGKQSPIASNQPAPNAARPGQDGVKLPKAAPPAGDAVAEADDDAAAAVCVICKRSVDSTEGPRIHDSSITHQICLQHSYPPSHLDRQRKGLQVLSSQGWDPDSRLGLGATGEGILCPIKATENSEKAGLGLKPEDSARRKAREMPVKLDAGKVRALDSERKRRGEKLRESFYRSDDLEKYLGDGGAQTVGVDIEAFKQARKSGLR